MLGRKMTLDATQTTPQKVLILSFTPTKSEPRALKQIRHLSPKFLVTSAGFGEQAVPGIKHIELEPKPITSFSKRVLDVMSLILHFYKHTSLKSSMVENARKALDDHQWDVIIAHDVSTVPLARSLNPKYGVLADLHEYAPKQGEDSFLWRLLIAPYFRWILRNHVVKCEAITTVGQGIVEEYKKQFGFSSTLVVNATPYKELTPTRTSFPIKLVHSGIPSPARKLELMIQAVKKAEVPVTFDLYLMQNNPDYLSYLSRIIGNDERIRILPPVPYSELVDTLNKYDLGLSMIAPTTFNLTWCLPNKFFDFIQARLGLIVGPSPEMVAFVEKYNMGMVTKDFTVDSLANTINSLSPKKVDQFKNASNASAEELSGERQAQIWVELVEQMIAA